MPKVTVQLVVYNSKQHLDKVFASVFAQTFTDFNVVAIICGNEDGSKEYISERFPNIQIIDPGKNLGFGGGHNLGLEQSQSEFVQLIGNDLLLEPDYLEKQLASFSDTSVASSTGKLYLYDFESNEKKKIIDTTGVIIYANGRARDRGQHEVDNGQYDTMGEVAAVSGAAPMYRRSALDAIRNRDGYVFDPFFFMYWEDVDLGLRLLHSGFTNVFAPVAVGYHGRGSGSSESGVRKLGSFQKHRSRQSVKVKRWNYTNHLYAVLKNYPSIGLGFFIREFLMFGYALVFETATLAVVPEFFRTLPAIFKRRKVILRASKISSEAFEKYFTNDERRLT